MEMMKEVAKVVVVKVGISTIAWLNQQGSVYEEWLSNSSNGTSNY